jgi:hypothetical protein
MHLQILFEPQELPGQRAQYPIAEVLLIALSESPLEGLKTLVVGKEAIPKSLNGLFKASDTLQERCQPGEHAIGMGDLHCTPVCNLGSDVVYNAGQIEHHRART